jgi:hypothetical protein
VVKTVYQQFFPLLALLENTNHQVGANVLGHRKMLYLEKLFATLLLASPRIQGLLQARLVELRNAIASTDGATNQANVVRVRNLLQLLLGLDVLVTFFLPAIFRVGFLVRSCTWDGRPAQTASMALNVLEQCMVLLVHLVPGSPQKNEYVRTLSVAILTWQRWHSSLPAVCYGEESCEALLSRVGNRLETYRTMTGFESAFDLFLSLPPPNRRPKHTRGMLKSGLVHVFVARIRRVIFSDGSLPYASALTTKQKSTTFGLAFPLGFCLPVRVPPDGCEARIQSVLLGSLRVLTGKRAPSQNVEQFLETHVRPRNAEDKRSYECALLEVAAAGKRAPPATGTGRPRPPRKVPGTLKKQRTVTSTGQPSAVTLGSVAQLLPAHIGPEEQHVQVCLYLPALVAEFAMSTHWHAHASPPPFRVQIL